jgi:predicted Zn-dependent peptidase
MNYTIIATFAPEMSGLQHQIHTLPNGIRLVHKYVDSPVAHLGLFINTGSRDELDKEHGLAHLIEHMLFKGTGKRKAYHILSRMEDVGGELNAYTTKEETCIHTTFFIDYYKRALELISDIALNSIFPDHEISKEREIIFDEINSYKDSPSELIFDEFEEMLFDGNPLGRNILGSIDALKTFKAEHIRNFINRNYSTEHMVVSSVGKIAFKKLIRLFEIYFSAPGMKITKERKIQESACIAESKTVERNTFQAHCIIGGPAFRLNDNRRLALYLLNNYLGGPGMNSRLNLALRERRGYAYTVDSMYTSYTDNGNITIYFGTDKSLVNKSRNIILKELKLLREKALTDLVLRKAKRQVLGQIAISSENNENYMLSMGKSLMIFNKIESLEEIGNKIDSISATNLLDIANEIFDPNKLSYLTYV